MNLARHIAPLTVRLRYHMKLKNPLLSDIKERYPLAYSMAADAATVLVDQYRTPLSDDELGYIALAFALAIERLKTEAPKKNILMVCASGAGSARLLEYRCRQEFGRYVNTVTTCDVLHLDRVDFSKIDYVFTTVPISQKLPVPVREVKYFLDDAQEVEGVRELLRGEPAPGGIACFFDERLFFPHVKGRSKRVVLDFLLDQVVSLKAVSPAYRELVWKREALVATSFGNLVAIPHPLQAASSESFVCVGLLDEPLRWDEYGHEVQAVFLVSFAPAEGKAQHDFLELFSQFLVSKEAVSALLEKRTLSALIDLLGGFALRRKDGNAAL